MTFDIKKEISQVNKNMGFIAQAMNRGILSGEINLQDNDNANMFRTFTSNLCAINERLLGISDQQIDKLSKKPTETVEFDRNKNSLSESVNNSDVTDDTGVAQEHSSCHCESEYYADDIQGDIVPTESNECNPGNNDPKKKRKSFSKANGIVGKKKKKDRNSSNIQMEEGGNSSRTKINEQRGHKGTLNEISLIEEYISRYTGVATRDCNSNRDVDLASYLERSIEECDDEQKYPHHAQCLVILIPTKPKITTIGSASSCSTSVSSGKGRLTVAQHFNDRSIDKIIVVERPREHCQLYVIGQLGYRYHFSSPTINITSLYKAMKKQHNEKLQILFIPRTCQKFDSGEILVVNGISPSRFSLQDTDFEQISQNISIMNAKGGGGVNKRSSHSMSLGLQTMYSHQQHQFRYCMLPHSKPHVPTVKQYWSIVRKSILDGYMFAYQAILESVGNTLCPFDLMYCGDETISPERKNARLSLRKDLYEHLIAEDIDHDYCNIEMNRMFESCTLQIMGKLPFHCDSMNCPSMDDTVALHVPFGGDKGDPQKCMSFLYYGRKCVDDYSSRIEVINKFIHDESGCLLTKLCLSALLETNGNFDYQGQLYENDVSLDKLAAIFETNPSTCCPQIREFSGLPCFKLGAAFDKMGYYSIFVNVFLSLFYMGIITTIDDSISLCIYFGLICNGTSNLAATWKHLCDNIDFCKQWLEKKDASTKLFRILIFLEKQRRREQNDSKILLGSCKLNRYQYSNYADFIENEADIIHCYIKDFLINHREKVSKEAVDVYSLHSELLGILSNIKGIGPLSFNQLWHSLCLCGVLPLNYINTTPVAIESGPAKLIQIFYPECKTSDNLIKKLQEVKGNMTKLGITTASAFFLENEMCEIMRFANKAKLLLKQCQYHNAKLH